MAQIDRTRKIVLTGLWAALAVLLSGIHFPAGPTKVFPFQHMVNALAGVLIGPWYGALAALIAALIRNALGTERSLPSREGSPGPLSSASSINIRAGIGPPSWSLSEPGESASWPSPSFSVP